MAECKICSDYTKLKSGLCFVCFQRNRETTDLSGIYSAGFKNNNRTYFSSVLTERVAKTLIKELFISLRYKVLNYNAGNHVFLSGSPGFIKPSQVKSGLEQAPDFVLQDLITGTPCFIKIKFCPGGNLAYADMSAKYFYPDNTYIIVVSKKQVKCLTVHELKNGKEIASECDHYLSNRKEFTKHKNTIEDYCEFSSKFFKAV